MIMKHFFDEIGPIFGGKLNRSQVNGIKLMIEIWQRDYSNYSDACFAYMLATAFHETGRKMQPVREGFAKTDLGAIRAVTKLYNRGRIKRNYAARDPKTGKSYFGRGLVQLTWLANYRRASKFLGKDLVHKPSLALNPEISILCLFEGVIKGWYGKRLTKYINQHRKDFVQARRCVNRLDKARLIAGYARKFDTAIAAAGGVSELDARSTKERISELRDYGSTTIKNADRINDIGVATGVTGLGTGVVAVKEITETGGQIKDIVTSATDVIVWAIQCWPLLLIIGAVALIYYAHQLKLNRVARETKIQRVKNVDLSIDEIGANVGAV